MNDFDNQPDATDAFGADASENYSADAQEASPAAIELSDEETEARARLMRANLEQFDLDEEDLALLDGETTLADSDDVAAGLPVLAVVGRPNAYLTKDVVEADWDDVDAYVVLRNSCNSAGEARFYHSEALTAGGKRKTRRVWDDFGTLTGGHDAGGDQYVMYKLSESFTMSDLHDLLTRFVDGLNAVAGYEAYDLVLPDDETECAHIVYA